MRMFATLTHALVEVVQVLETMDTQPTEAEPEWEVVEPLTPEEDGVPRLHLG